MKNQCNIAVFASGAGSNAEKIIGHFQNHPYINIVLIVSNKPGAGVVQIAKAHQIPVLLIKKQPFFETEDYIQTLHEHNIDLLVLAGFLWKIPLSLIHAFPEKIINIHPALLPKYGGKGMYGHHVHEAVIAAGEKKSGITIHLVDEQYDHGRHLFQAECAIASSDTPDSLAEKIHRLEHQYFAPAIENYIEQNMREEHKD